MPKGKPNKKPAVTIPDVEMKVVKQVAPPAPKTRYYEDYKAISDATDGYLSEEEANLLWSTATQAYKNTGNYWVEDGSYQGKSAVMIAGALALLAMGDTTEHVLVCVDPHEGKLSFPSHYAEDKLLDSDHLSEEEPTFDTFHRTVDEAGLGDVIVNVKDRFTNFTAKQPIDLILIDGLHDLDSVRADWEHAKPMLTDGAFVMFHDYQKWHGPTLVVDTAIAYNELQFIAQAESLVVCKFLGAK